MEIDVLIRTTQEMQTIAKDKQDESLSNYFEAVLICLLGMRRIMEDCNGLPKPITK